MESKSESAKESSSGSSGSSGSSESSGSSGSSGSSEDSGGKSSGFNRGERQKRVTKSYRNNWDDAFGKKPRRKKKK